MEVTVGLDVGAEMLINGHGENGHARNARDPNPQI